MPTEANNRQAFIMRKQIALTAENKRALWKQLIRKKIENQSRALYLLSLDGRDKVEEYVSFIDEGGDPDTAEALAAKRYFEKFSPGFGRRDETPLNSQLDYGYAVLRNVIIRALLCAGFQPALGIHHDNKYNAFNLADDLIEPWRPMVDITAAAEPANDIRLSKEERYAMAMSQHHTCRMDGKEVTVLSGISLMVSSLQRYVLGNEDTELVLPELYMRVTTNRKSAETHINRMKDKLPDTGKIVTAIFTERQYSNLRYLVGSPSAQETIIGANCHIAL